MFESIAYAQPAQGAAAQPNPVTDQSESVLTAPAISHSRRSEERIAMASAKRAWDLNRSMCQCIFFRTLTCLSTLRDRFAMADPT